MVLNKKTVIVASSFAAISLAVVLIAAATHRARRKSLQTSRFLGQTDQNPVLLQLLPTGSNKMINHNGKRNPLSEYQRQKQRLQLIPFLLRQLLLTKIPPTLQQYHRR